MGRIKHTLYDENNMSICESNYIYIIMLVKFELEHELNKKYYHKSEIVEDEII